MIISLICAYVVFSILVGIRACNIQLSKISFYQEEPSIFWKVFYVVAMGIIWPLHLVCGLVGKVILFISKISGWED